MLARFIPKQWIIGAQSRAAAVWALGLIHEPAPPPEVVDGLIGRLTDESTTVPEDLGVCSMCAVALGRMKVKDAADSLRKYYPGRLSAEPFPNACGWALGQITGGLRGTVADPTGAAVPKAMVTLTNLETKQARTQSVNASGEFTFELFERHAQTRRTQRESAEISVHLLESRKRFRVVVRRV